MVGAWDLPGPRGFVDRVDRRLRGGGNVVLRFPGDVPRGFDDALQRRCDFARWTVFDGGKLRPPVDGLARRFAPRAVGVTELCESEGFRGRVVWVDGVRAENWGQWETFLSRYGHVSRNTGGLSRTRFVVVISGRLPEGNLWEDVTIENLDWAGAVSEMDLLILAHFRAEGRAGNETRRALLATTVARVAAWDVDVAEMLLDEEDDGIVDPWAALRRFAAVKGWDAATPAEWGVGTASIDGAMHAALAALTDPRVVRRRLWSAQASVLLPRLDSLRYRLIRENVDGIAAQLRREGDGSEPFDLDFGPLEGVVSHSACPSEVVAQARDLNRARRKLAHLEPLPPGMLRWVVGW